ncbi:hypothetical protein OY671_008501 [Metschnikowia pulcherrima]|nr:hypothetical protein OY671_008501 [Metschnikowia pulcherrima]
MWNKCMSTTLLNRPKILVVEDECLIAEELRICSLEAGADVIGPVGVLEDASNLAGSEQDIACALVDIGSEGGMTYAVAEYLDEHSIPYSFTTGYSPAAIPDRFGGIGNFQKPIRMAALSRGIGDSIDA